MKFWIQILAIYLFGAPVWSQQQTSKQYKEQLRTQYSAAVKFFVGNQYEIAAQCTRYKVPARAIVSIVFPEVMRFNQLSNFMETSALHAAYTNGGKEVVDFSIGHFQMKPSFVERLEQSVQHNIAAWGQPFANVAQYKSNHEAGHRYERLQRMEQLSWQVTYACCFYAYVVNTFGRYFLHKSEEDKIWFLAAAYNVGIQYNSEHIERIGSIPNFPYGVRQPSENQYVYSDVALDFYINMKNPFYPK